MKLWAPFIILISSISLAHEGHHHGEHTQAAKGAVPMSAQAVYREIDSDYQVSVKPIFDRKCAACHSLSVQSPWYSKVPGVGWIVESDRSEAKEHLEISKGFPFGGHGTTDEDLDAILESVRKNTMPTFLYKVMHPSSKLSTEEQAAITAWIERSREKLKDIPEGE